MYSSVTGLANDGSYILVHGKDYYGDPVDQRFSSSGSSSSLYMDEYPGLGDTVYDTAWISGGLWIARDDPDSPILAYDTDGLQIGYVDGATVSAAMGLTIDDDGYLWASNPDDDKIYQIEVTTGIAENPEEPSCRNLRIEENPFRSVAMITGEGFSDAQIEILDVTGRRLIQSSFSGLFAWNAVDVPTGVYFAVVNDGWGSQTLRMTRLP